MTNINKAAEEGELPEPDTHCYDEDTQADVWSYSKGLIQKILAADRASRQVLVPGSIDHDAFWIRVAACRDAKPGAAYRTESEELVRYVNNWASRQVANKAEVDLRMLIANLPLPNASKERQHGFVDCKEVLLNMLATPPATTGTSTAKSIDTPEFQEMMAEWFNHDDAETAYSGVHWKRIVDHINKHNAVGASTVLTDERIKEEMHAYFSYSGNSDNKFWAHVDDIVLFAQWVAAQAGQVAVPEIGILMDALKDCARHPRLAQRENIVSKALAKVAAPSPAKESKSDGQFGMGYVGV